MSFGSSATKRGRDEDATSNKRARTAFSDFNPNQQTMQMPPQTYQQQQFQHFAVTPESNYQQFNQQAFGTTMDMDMSDQMLEDDEDEDEESPACGAALAARLSSYTHDYEQQPTPSNPTHAWNSNAPRMLHQLSASSLSSGASSAAPNTPLDFPDQYCAFGGPSSANPQQSAFVDAHGQTRHFSAPASAPPTPTSMYAPNGMIDEATAFANYALNHGYQKTTESVSLLSSATHAAWTREKLNEMRGAETSWPSVPAYHGA